MKNKNTELVQVIKENNDTIVEMLLKQGVNPNEPMPGRRRCEDFPESLGKDCQCARGDMSVVIVGNHVFYNVALLGCNLLWVIVAVNHFPYGKHCV